SSQLRTCEVVVLRLRRCCLPEAVGLIRRRGLVARRRIGQRSARRLAGKLRCLFLFPAKHRVPYAIRAAAKLCWKQLVAETSCLAFIAVAAARLLFLGVRAGSKLIRAQWILLTLTLVADVAILLPRRLGLTARHVGILRPRRIIGGYTVGLFGRRQLAARW